MKMLEKLEIIKIAIAAVRQLHERTKNDEHRERLEEELRWLNRRREEVENAI